MSIEPSVYTRRRALTGAELRQLAKRERLELRFLDAPARVPADQPDHPLEGHDYVLIGWPAAHTGTTARVDQALRQRDKAAIDRLGRAAKLAWFEFRCHQFDYGKYWGEYPPGEREAFEASVPAGDLGRMKRAKTRYVFRCGTGPRQNGRLLGKVARLIRDATDGFLVEG